MEPTRKAPTNRTCLLCEQFVPTDVKQYERKIGTEIRVIHETCAKSLAEDVLNVMYTETTKVRRKKKKKRKKDREKEKGSVEQS